MDPNYHELSKALKAISDPKRLRIIHMLARQELGASELLAAFDVTQPTLSHDMRILRDSGLVAERRIGKTVQYRLASEEVAVFCRTMTAVFCPDGLSDRQR